MEIGPHMDNNTVIKCLHKTSICVRLKLVELKRRGCTHATRKAVQGIGCVSFSCR